MRIALYQPDIPQNTGTILRLAACFDLPVDIIEPCGFVFDDRRLKRSGMDYLEHASYTRHASWAEFNKARQSQRLILLTTKAETSYIDFRFSETDILLLGSESSGAPEEVHRTVDARVKIPLSSGLRSLNIALAAAIVVGEAARQINLFQKLALKKSSHD